MKRFLRWALVLILIVMVAAVTVPLYLRNRVQQRPTWYPKVLLDIEGQRLAAHSVDQKLLEASRLAHRAHYAEIEARHSAAPGAAPATQPAVPITLELTEEEINASFAKWEAEFHWRDRISKYAQDPMLVVQDNELILAATVKDYWNAVVSLHFEPKLENGKLQIKTSSVMAGTLEIPQTAYGSYLHRLDEAVDRKMPGFREGAEIGPRGWANSAAVSAAMGELLIHALNGEPAEPVLFVPEPGSLLGKNSRSLPMRITSIDISKKTLTITLVPMNPDEREALLNHLRGPVQAETATAMGK